MTDQSIVSQLLFLRVARKLHLWWLRRIWWRWRQLGMYGSTIDALLAKFAVASSAAESCKRVQLWRLWAYERRQQSAGCTHALWWGHRRAASAVLDQWREFRRDQVTVQLMEQHSALCLTYCLFALAAEWLGQWRREASRRMYEQEQLSMGHWHWAHTVQVQQCEP